jgi:hypothetical protein
MIPWRATLVPNIYHTLVQVKFTLKAVPFTLLVAMTSMVTAATPVVAAVPRPHILVLFKSRQVLESSYSTRVLYGYSRDMRALFYQLSE